MVQAENEASYKIYDEHPIHQLCSMVSVVDSEKFMQYTCFFGENATGLFTILQVFITGTFKHTNGRRGTSRCNSCRFVCKVCLISKWFVTITWNLFHKLRN